jgi:hypothetical protein
MWFARLHAATQGARSRRIDAGAKTDSHSSQPPPPLKRRGLQQFSEPEADQTQPGPRNRSSGSVIRERSTSHLGMRRQSPAL